MKLNLSIANFVPLPKTIDLIGDNNVDNYGKLDLGICKKILLS